MVLDPSNPQQQSIAITATQTSSWNAAEVGPRMRADPGCTLFPDGLHFQAIAFYNTLDSSWSSIKTDSNLKMYIQCGKYPGRLA